MQYLQPIQLPDGFRIRIMYDTWDRVVKVIIDDIVSDTHAVLAYFSGGRWMSEFEGNLRKFIRIVRTHACVHEAIKLACIKLRESQDPYSQMWRQSDYVLKQLAYLLIKVKKRLWQQ